MVKEMNAGNPHPLLSAEQAHAIEQAVAAAELTTSGEIVPVILPRSDAYPGARWRFAVAFSLLCAFAFVVACPDHHPIWSLWIQLPALAAGYALGGLAWLARAFLAGAEMDEEVRQRAIEAFELHGLRATRDRTGVLILVSLLEHRVVVLADVGINAKVPDGTWDGVVSRLTERSRQGDWVHGFVAAIAECGEILAKDFPRRPDDRNEISDQAR